MQPKPKPNNAQPIHEQVIEDIKRRAEVGKQNYGTYLQANNGRDSLVDAYEEAQDLALYLKQAILERDAEANADAIALAVRALEEVRLWIPDGTKRSPKDRGAKVETTGELTGIVETALAALKGGGK